jgi:methionyl-tRNA formyltransferase
MKKNESSILFLGKYDDEYGTAALEFCRRNFNEVTAKIGRWGDPIPEELKSWDGDYIISYLSRWVVPEWLLKKARIAAFNFHPASPEYPGIGCNNFALYENAKEYGATCHHMLARVDTGPIIAVKRFPLYPADDVASVLSRTYAFQLVLFYEVMGFILAGKDLPASEERWTRRPFTRKEFEELRRITPDMSKEEIARRVRATAYGIWNPVVELEGFVFQFKSELDS